MSKDNIAAEITRLLDAYGFRLGEDDAAREAGYRLATKGQRQDVVRQAVDDFLSGSVDRKQSARGRAPTSEEFGAYVRDLARKRPAARLGQKLEYAPPFGPLWGVKVYQLLLDGPDDPHAIAPRFVASMIAKGGETGDVYRLHHQAATGFKTVNAMFERAFDGKGWNVEDSLEPVTAAMEAVPVDGYRISNWRGEHTLRGWPWLPSFGRQRVVYLPTGGPAEIGYFDKVLRSAQGKPASDNKTESAIEPTPSEEEWPDDDDVRW